MATGYSEKDIKIINIYLGCRLRFERLKRNLSQHDLGVLSGTDSTAVGRIERAEHISAWSKIFLVSHYLGVDFKKLFVLKSKDELLSIVKECYSLEVKLNKEKEKYYNNLISEIEQLFSKK